MNSILQESNSPTQQRVLNKQKTKTIESVIIDNDFKEFPIEITYDYTDYNTWQKWEVSVWGFDYKVNGTVNMSQKQIVEDVKNIIEQEERVTVTFY